MATITGLAYGTVDCRVLIESPDLDDADSRPDEIAPSGFVYLKARKNVIGTTSDTIPTIAIPDIQPLVIDSQGYACIPDAEGSPTSQRSIDLPAVEGMTWTASFDLTIPAYVWQSGVIANKVTVKAFDFPVTQGETTHIADYLPLGVDPSTGATFIKGDRGLGVESARSVNNALVLKLDDGTELSPVPLPASTVPGPANKLSIGTVTSGTTPAATITGTAPNQTLNLTLARGDKGDTGDPGAGIPDGGTMGQIPARTADGGSEWRNAIDLVADATTTAHGLMPAVDRAALAGASSNPAASALVKMNSSGMFNVGTPTSSGHPTTKAYVDAADTKEATARVAGDGDPGFTRAAPLPKTRKYESWPVIVEAADGSITAAYGSGTQHAPKSQRWVKFVRSTNRGRTWTQATEFAESGRDLSIYSIGRAANGTLVAIYRSVLIGSTTDWKFQVVKSTNNGASWAKSGSPVTFTNTPVLIGPITTLANGNMIAAWHAEASEGGGTTAAGIMRSTDSGTTWAQETITTMGDASGNLPVEGRLAQLDDGRVVYLARINTQGLGYLISVGDSTAKTWTTFVQTNIKDGYISPPAIVAQGGLLYVYYFDRATHQHRYVVAPQSVVDAPTTFPASTVYGLSQTTTRYDSGYTAVWPSSTGAHLLVFYTGYTNYTACYFQTATTRADRGWSVGAGTSGFIMPLMNTTVKGEPSMWNADNTLNITSRGNQVDGFAYNVGGTYLGAIMVPSVTDWRPVGALYARILGVVIPGADNDAVTLSLAGFTSGGTSGAKNDAYVCAVSGTNTSGTYTYLDSGWVPIPPNIGEILQTTGDGYDNTISQLVIRGCSATKNCKVHEMTTVLIGMAL